MVDEPRVDEDQQDKALDILESNFKDSLEHLHKYLTFTLVISVVYLAVIIAPQDLELPGLPVKVQGEFALALLAAIYVAVGGMATYVTERANAIAVVLVKSRAARFEALRLTPSIAASDVPVVRFLVSFLPTAIFSLHLAYVAYQASNGVVAIPIIFYLAVGVTLWLLLPVGKRAINRLTERADAS